MDRLAVIIADMVKSALFFEEEHGIPHNDNRKNEPQKWLTVISVSDTLNASEYAVKGDNNDHQN
ncbi:hypothetical protein ACFLWS_06585 [Chloroflexota bacterium]